VKRGVTRTFQITTLFPGLTVLESVVLAINERTGSARAWRKTVASCRAEIDEAKAGLGATVNDIRRWMADVEMHPGYRWEIGGHYLKQQEAFFSLALVMVVAVLLAPLASVTTTVAPTITPPNSSLTCPFSVVFPCWASARLTLHNRIRNKNKPFIPAFFP